jgi:hypothetical protein
MIHEDNEIEAQLAAELEAITFNAAPLLLAVVEQGVH